MNRHKCMKETEKGGERKREKIKHDIQTAAEKRALNLNSIHNTIVNTHTNELK